MTSEQRFGEQLRQARQAQDRTLEELARCLGVTAGYLSMVENGRRKLTAQQLERVCEALNVPRATYERLFQTLGKLPPTTVAHLLKHPEKWRIEP